MPTTPPYSYIDFGLSGDLTDEQLEGNFNNVPLEIINTADVYVIRTTSGGVATTLSSSNFTVTESGSVLNVVISGITLNTDDIIRIGRTTPIGTVTRTFTDGSVLKAGDLNDQNNQLLFAVQENVDGGIGSLPVDTDNKFDAGGKIIKNLGFGSNNDDAVSKSYVDGLSLYGSAASIPQSWSFTTASSDVSGSDRVFTLNSPTPTATNDEFYIIEVDGVIQTPDTYVVNEVSDIYTLTLTGGASSVADGVVVHVRNFGISRHILSQPVKADSGSDTSLTVQRIGSQTGHLQKWIDESSATLASVDKDGNASFVGSTASGNASIGGTLGVTGASTLTGGISGNLNILSGALQYAGTNTLQILQIVEAANQSTVSTLSHGGIRLADKKITIQPKKSDSKIIFVYDGSVVINLLTSLGVSNNLGFICRVLRGATGAADTFVSSSGIDSLFLKQVSWKNSINPSAGTLAYASSAQLGFSNSGVFMLSETFDTSTPMVIDLAFSSLLGGSSSLNTQVNSHTFFAVELG